MKFESGRLVRKKVEINLVPLLDSIFILIFFFMFALTTMVKRSGLAVALPTSQSGKKVEEKTTLTVSETGALFWNKEPLPVENLKSQLENFKLSQPESSLIIRGDRNTPFSSIVEILDVAESIQLRRVTIETEQK
jgi:biopolymer transport protein ExbD